MEFGEINLNNVIAKNFLIEFPLETEQNFLLSFDLSSLEKLVQNWSRRGQKYAAAKMFDGKKLY